MKTKETAEKTPPTIEAGKPELVPVGKVTSITHQVDYGPANREIVRQTVAPDLQPQEFEYFWAFCIARRLNPLTGQVHPVVRRVKKGDNWERRVTMQTSVDGFLAIADRTRCYAPSDRAPEFKTDPKTGEPLECTVWVKKFVQGEWHEYPATLRMAEIAPLEKDGDKWARPFMWKSKPFLMLEKCTLVKALRRGFPEELGDLYVHEEMEQATYQQKVSEGASAAVAGASAAGKSKGKLKPSTEANRGHADTGTEKLAAPAAPTVSDVPASTKEKCIFCRDGVIETAADGAKLHWSAGSLEPTGCPHDLEPVRTPLPEGERMTFVIAEVALKTSVKKDPAHPDGKREERYAAIKTTTGKSMTFWHENSFQYVEKARRAGLPVVGVIKMKEKDGKTYCNLLALAKVGEQEFDGDGPIVDI